MAASAVSPSTLPTIMVSTVLYSCWNKLDTRMGSMNSRRFLKIGPCSRSAFRLKRFVFRGRVWVIGFLSSRKKEAVAQKTVQWPLLRLNDFECPPLSLWAYSAEKLFLICAPETTAVVSGALFHEKGRNGKRHLF